MASTISLGISCRLYKLSCNTPGLFPGVLFFYFRQHPNKTTYYIKTGCYHDWYRYNGLCSGHPAPGGWSSLFLFWSSVSAVFQKNQEEDNDSDEEVGQRCTE